MLLQQPCRRQQGHLARQQLQQARTAEREQAAMWIGDTGDNSNMLMIASQKRCQQQQLGRQQLQQKDGQQKDGRQC
jgi:hypothetical protein